MEFCIWMVVIERGDLFLAILIFMGETNWSDHHVLLRTSICGYISAYKINPYRRDLIRFNCSTFVMSGISQNLFLSLYTSLGFYISVLDPLVVISSLLSDAVFSFRGGNT